MLEIACATRRLALNHQIHTFNLTHTIHAYQPPHTVVPYHTMRIVKHAHTHTHMHTFYHATTCVNRIVPHTTPCNSHKHTCIMQALTYIWQMWLCMHACNPDIHNPCLPVCTLASTSTRYAGIPETNWILISSACLPSEWINCNNNSSSTASVVCKQVYVYIYVYING